MDIDTPIFFSQISPFECQPELQIPSNFDPYIYAKKNFFVWSTTFVHTYQCTCLCYNLLNDACWRLKFCVNNLNFTESQSVWSNPPSEPHTFFLSKYWIGMMVLGRSGLGFLVVKVTAYTEFQWNWSSAITQSEDLNLHYQGLCTLNSLDLDLLIISY